MEADSIGSRVGSGRLNERVGLCWRTWWSFGEQVQMDENLGNAPGIFDRGDAREVFGHQGLHAATSEEFVC